MSHIVREYYNKNAEFEWDRLNNPYSKVEFESTVYLIEKYFKRRGKILDIGCGPGRYSIELLKKGYNVTLSDLSQEELNIAENKINDLGLKAGITECPEEFVDIEMIYACMDDRGLSNEECFTEAYFSIPPKALEEVKEAGFNVISYAGAESFISGIRTQMYKLFNENRKIYDNLLKVAAEKCEEEQYRDASEHLNIVVRK